MSVTRPIAALSLAVFLLGGWLPQVLHGPMHLPAASTAASSAGDLQAACVCGHHHGPAAADETTDAARPTPQPADDCPVCELLSVLTLPQTATQPPRPVPVRATSVPAVESAICAAAITQPPLRGPPTWV